LLIGAGPSPDASEAGAALSKGVAYLQKESERWKTEKKCASCHHLPMAIWALGEARRSGQAIDEALLERWKAWVLADPEAKVFVPLARKSPSLPGLDMATVYTSLALSALPAWGDRERNAWSQFAADIAGKQTADGSFPGGVGRPPILERPEATTALAVLALSPPEAEAARREDAASSRSRAMEWLAKSPTGGSHQAQVLRLLIMARSGAPAEAARGLIADLRNRQGREGGWGQTTEMASDALATGQSLYVLRAAGIPAPDPAIRRGVEFLVKTQRPEGDWAMSSRPVLGQPDGGPSKDLSPITAAGSAWAVMGLARAVPAR
jgi:hypothetical protein